MTGVTAPTEVGVAPNALSLRRLRAPLAWLATSAVTIAATWWFVAVTVSPSPARAVDYVLLGLIVGLWLPFMIMFVWMEGTLARNARLALTYPDSLRLAVFFGTWDRFDASEKLRAALGLAPSGSPLALPHLVTLIVDAHGIKFYGGTRRPRELYVLPWAQVGPIETGQAHVDSFPRGSNQYAINIGVIVSQRDSASEGFHWLSCMAWRASGWVGFGYASHRIIDAFADAINSRRAAATSQSDLDPF